ncbi:hypothetical protein I3842_09G198300 [Carya illinoinensis]|uniref:Uncharacterized protein n=1 Tax=Carya illinoinensis TaxID=32201 RepID=A0A922J7B3_CARIL|nr:hypothetical protein I3842_09G198300 [Carya illinoinensis]
MRNNVFFLNTNLNDANPFNRNDIIFSVMRDALQRPAVQPLANFFFILLFFFSHAAWHFSLSLTSHFKFWASLILSNLVPFPSCRCRHSVVVLPSSRSRRNINFAQCGRSQGKLDVKTPSPTPRSRPTFRAAVFCASSQLSFPGTSCMHLLINTLALKLHLKYRESLMEEYD